MPVKHKNPKSRSTYLNVICMLSSWKLFYSFIIMTCKLLPQKSQNSIAIHVTFPRKFFLLSVNFS
uniref:Uncharacterized protein n=1 Tax=Arundo donax TaxID=35708 RepID=A0A0A8YV67_ARUDO